MEFTVKRFARPAALGALGVSAGAIGLYLLVAFIASPVPRGGIDSTHAMLTWISVSIPIAALVAAHVVYALQLFRYSKTPD